MILLGIETSCDETSVAVVEGKNGALSVRSNCIASSMDTHSQTGGIIPENAARAQLHYMLPVLQEALQKADIGLSKIDTIAVTYGPGLIGSLLVGVETARTIAYSQNIPIIPINHMIGHVYANWITHCRIQFPALALVISGGHTDLLLIKDHGKMQLLGGTRDDAAGEALDKIARLIGIASYPGGAAIEKAAKLGNPKRFSFPRPMLHSQNFEFSFSGLKTAVLKEVKTLKKIDEQTINDLARATQDAVIDVITKKTLKAAATYNVSSLLLSGGVAANQTLYETFKRELPNYTQTANLFVPEKRLCTDNAAMIASAGYFNFHPSSWQELITDPELYF